MQLNGTELRYGLLSSVELSSVNAIATAQLGTPSTAFPYAVPPNVAYSMVLEIEPGETLTLDTTTGTITGASGATRAYRIDGLVWNATDIEGMTLPLVPSICGVLARCSTPGATVTITVNGEDSILVAPSIILSASADGRHPWSIESVAFTADPNGAAAVIIVDIHASSAGIELDDDPSNFGALNITGTLTDGTDSIVFPEMEEVGTSGGKAAFSGNTGIGLEGGTSSCEWDAFELKFYLVFTPLVGSPSTWESSDNVATPNLVTTWTAVSPATGTPVAEFEGYPATYVGQPAIVNGTDIYRALTINPTTWSGKLN